MSKASKLLKTISAITETQEHAELMVKIGSVSVEIVMYNTGVGIFEWEILLDTEPNKVTISASFEGQPEDIVAFIDNAIDFILRNE